MGESKSKGGGDGIRITIRIVDRNGRGGGTELRQWVERLEWAEWSGASADQWEVNAN